MKTKIFNALKQAYSSLGLSDEVLSSQADSLASMGFVTDENLATVVQGQSTFLKTLQSGIDRRVTDAVAKAKQERTDPKPTDPKQEEKHGGLSKEEIAAIVSETIKPFADKLTGFEAQTQAQKRQAEVIAKAKEAGIPDSFVSRLAIPDDANLDEYFKGVKQDFTNIGFQVTTPPDQGKGSPEKEGEAIASLIDQGTKEIVESKK